MMFDTRDAFAQSIFLLTIGYSVGSLSLEVLERTLHNILIPVYTCGVLGYLTFLTCNSHREKYHIQETKFERKNENALLEDSIATQADQPIDMTGVYKLIENQNFEEFLATQGVPWALRGAANRARPTHRITHRGDIIAIKIEGIIESQTTYKIGGPPVRGLVRGRVFEDQVTYLEDHSGIQTTKRAVDNGYTVIAQRRFAQNRSQIVTDTFVVFDDERKDRVCCKQIFSRLKE